MEPSGIAENSERTRSPRLSRGDLPMASADLIA
jgi:hypothetical protein